MGAKRCLEDFESPDPDWDPVFDKAPPDAWSRYRNVSKFWLLCDELKVQDAALLVLGLEPHRRDLRHPLRANGSDFHQRKCPHCQGGMPGLDISEWLKTFKS
ncbi:hypothetical protein [Henriciella aquimarina]|uniref:hypothetical protein n=1 Tax=Henriciella aquimarina TaxID=545261 RepID=UPI0009FCB00F|nr:hypothetical protein [Henriciella aquimarina]